MGQIGITQPVLVLQGSSRIVSSITAPAGSDLTLTAGSTNQNVQLTPTGSGTVQINGTPRIRGNGNLVLGTVNAGDALTIGSNSGDVTLSHGLVGTGATGGSQGAGTGNFSALYVNGVAVGTSTGNVSTTGSPAAGQYAVFTNGTTISGVAPGGSSITDTSGAVAIAAAGTNQNITLTPSGTGAVWVKASDPAFVFSTDGTTTNASIDYSTALNIAGRGASVPVDIYAGGINPANRVARFTTNLNVLINTTTDNSNGVLQLASSTSSSKGIGFGSDTTFYRSAANTVTTSGAWTFGGAITGTTANFSGAAVSALIQAAASGAVVPANGSGLWLDGTGASSTRYLNFSDGTGWTLAFSKRSGGTYTPLFSLSDNGNSTLAGTLTVSGTGTSSFSGPITTSGTNASGIVSARFINTNATTNTSSLIELQGTTKSAYIASINDGRLYLWGNAAPNQANFPAETACLQFAATGAATLNGTLTVSGTGTSSFAGPVSLGTAGSAISIKSGTNAAAGTVTLVAGTGTISSTAITANSVIFFSEKTSGGTPGVYQPLAAVSAGSATVTSAATDSSTYNWIAMLVN